MATPGINILKAGFLVGLLDIAAAFIQYYYQTGNNPLNVLKFIASGVFGNQAFSGGAVMIPAGLLFHFLIAFAFTLFFFWIVPKINFLLRNRILTGVLYGIFVWTIMNIVVLPLSKAPALPFTVSGAVTGVLLLIFCVGLPLALMLPKRHMHSSAR